MTYIKRTITQKLERWTDVDRNVFIVTAVYNPNEEPDPWVSYYNSKTKQEYTCRLEAFEARFFPLAD